MKILLVWPTPDPLIKMLLDEIELSGHEIVYWVGEWPTAHLTPAGAIFHDHYDAWAAQPAKVLAAQSTPPDEGLIHEMVSTESAVLPMMNKRYDVASVDERKQVYYDMLGYWNSVIEKLKPDAVVFGTIPHSIYGYIIYELARKRGIPTLCSEPTWVACRHLFYRDFRKGSDAFRESIERFRTQNISPSELDVELQEYWEGHTGKNARTEPVYTATERKVAQGWGHALHRLRTAVKTLHEGRFISTIVANIRLANKGKLRSDYARVVKPADLKKPFVYFPLHFQPECTTTPQGGVFHQQILVAETLAAALPDGWELYMKEHPGQWWARAKDRYSCVRYPGYYEPLARIPRAQLVPVDTNTYDLTDRSRAVAVINGTAGWEALLHGKCPLVFGIPWWRDYPGVFRVNSVESCMGAFREIEAGAHTTQASMLPFLKALEEASVRVYTADPMEKKPRYTPEENMRMLAAHVCKLIRAM